MSSIRLRLLKWLVAPILVFNLLAASLTYLLAWTPAQRAFDQGLLDAATGLAPRLRPGGAAPELPANLPANLPDHSVRSASGPPYHSSMSPRAIDDRIGSSTRPAARSAASPSRVNQRAPVTSTPSTTTSVVRA